MVAPPGRTPPRRLGLALAAVPLIAVLLADATIVAHRQGTTRVPPPAPRQTTGFRLKILPPLHPDADRAAAIRLLLERRSRAVLHHDRAGFLSTVDPARPRFRREQAREFANLADVPFASWSYEFTPTSEQPTVDATTRYDAPTWAPATFTLHYRLRGFDARPTNLPQFPTFVERGQHWYLASFTDFRSIGLRSSTELWDYGPVQVVHTPHVLVLGHPRSPDDLQAIAAEAEADIPRVNAVWGPHWSRRAVVLVPATQHELGAVIGDAGNLDRIAAVASAEVQDSPGTPNPVGDRIGINPRNWGKLSALGRQIVLTHELTHVATRAATASAAPTWLVEGFADYVGYLGAGVSTVVAAHELAVDVQAGREPRRLPGDAQYDGSSAHLAQAYEEGWLACRMIAERWGQATLVRFYRAVGTAPVASSTTALASAAQSLLHLSVPAFVADWRAYVHAQLS